ncbi:MAG: hypothetical protein CSB33_01605 [Desulfobacterales bacterium]|nr:MAG: hypothetical protein CSB33_01605 [Desulfobacterales bacterium]
MVDGVVMRILPSPNQWAKNPYTPTDFFLQDIFSNYIILRTIPPHDINTPRGPARRTGGLTGGGDTVWSRWKAAAVLRFPTPRSCAMAPL